MGEACQNPNYHLLLRVDLPVTIKFVATMSGYIMDVVETTISADSHSLGISLSPALVQGEYMRLVTNWMDRFMNMDLYASQIDKYVTTLIQELIV